VSANTSGEAIKKAIKKLQRRLGKTRYWRIDWEDENGKCGGREGKGY
jgi:hypothetical protein